MDDFDRKLRDSLTQIRDGSSNDYRRSVFEARAETIERTRRRRTQRFMATGAVAVAALAATVYFVARPTLLDRSSDLPLTGTPKVEVDYLEPAGITQVGDQPRDVSVGGLGRLWTANVGNKTISQIDETGDETNRFDLPSVPGDVAIGGGPVWVALPQEGAVVEIDPTDGPKEPIVVSDPVDSMELTVGDGVLWVVARGSELLLIDMADGSVDEVELPAPPLDVAVHGSSAWILTNAGSVMSLDPVTRTAEEPIHNVSPSDAGDLTFASNSLWYFTGTDGDLLRIAPDGSGDQSTSTFEGTVVDLAIDPQVAWALLHRDDGSSWLQRVDRKTGEPEGQAVPIEGDAIEAAIAHDHLWISLTDRDELARFPKL